MPWWEEVLLGVAAAAPATAALTLAIIQQGDGVPHPSVPKAVPVPAHPKANPEPEPDLCLQLLLGDVAECKRQFTKDSPGWNVCVAKAQYNYEQCKNNGDFRF